MTPAGLTPDSFKEAMCRYASGVTIITVHDADGAPVGMTATAFSSVASEPPLVLICVHGATRTYQRVLRSGYFGVNLLGADAEPIAAHCSRPGGSKVLPPDWLLDDPQWTAPAVAASLAFVDCETYRHFPAGTHHVIVGRVRGIGLGPAPDPGPLVHYQRGYQALHPLQETTRMPLTAPLTANGSAR
ncbi:flavin reductase family protein [Dactylosporangium sp. NPDC050688]|uniref:flavin reductase family protein n=1 Tax=Dactylosporangium sp. NPDC050688 TaxID=3157217 RepID=UPI0033D1259B